MRTILRLTCGLVLCCAVGAVAAEGVGKGLRPSTPGIGLEVSSSALEIFGPRIWSAVARDDVEEAVIRYDAAPRVGTGLLLADWHPGGTGFRVSGGLAYNQQRSDVFGRTGGLIGIGGRDPITMLGTFDGRMRYAKPNPYLGLGWGIMPSRKSGLYFSADVGLVYQRPNSVPLSGCPALSSACGVSADLRDEAEYRSAVEEFRFFPVVTFGVGLRF